MDKNMTEKLIRNSDSVSRGLTNSPLIDTNYDFEINYQDKEFIENVLKQGANICIDYFKFSFPEMGSNMINLKSIFVDCLSTEGPKAINYGTSEILDKEFYFFYGGPKNANEHHTALLEIKGSGCRRFEELGYSWRKLFETCLSIPGGRVTRIDLAIDVFDPTLLDINLIIQKVNNLEYLSRLDEVFFYKKISKKNDCIKGNSITFGTRESSHQIQFYDKKAERESTNIDTWCNYWWRIEMRFYGEKGNNVLGEILACTDLNECVPSMLLDVLDFKEPNENDQNKSRWKTCKWWKDFLNYNQKIRIYNQKKIEATFEKKAKWISSSAARNLEILKLVMGKDQFNNFVDEVSDKKIFKLKNKDLIMINEALEKFGHKPMTLNQFENLKDTIKEKYEMEN